VRVEAADVTTQTFVVLQRLSDGVHDRDKPGHDAEAVVKIA
jgi:hypothetical protein